MKKLFIVLAMIAIFSLGASAEFKDSDGNMVLAWQHNNTKNPLKHFVVRYTINNVLDSIIITTTFLEDSTCVLFNPGDSVNASVQAISIFGDSSDIAYSDVAYYDVGTGIDPPSGILWK